MSSESSPLIHNPSLHRKLNSRQLNMIAIGGILCSNNHLGTIGTGLFLGSGATIFMAGPLGSLVSFSIVGFHVYSVVSSLGEMSTLLPIPGSFNTFAGRFVDPAFAFTLGWNYWLQWAITLPSEISALAIVMKFWNTGVSDWVWSCNVLILLVLINIIGGVKTFGESEYLLSFIKVIAVCAFIIIGSLLDIGAFSHSAVFFQNWALNPFKNGIDGIFDVFLIAFFAFGGTELVGMTAAEAQNPKITLPKAISQTFWRILLFYICSIFIMGLLIRNDDPRLLNPSENSNITQSPFTIVFEMAGFPFAAHLMNAVVVTAILSASNSAMYAASRTLMALSLSGQAPKAFGILYNGIPIVALSITVLIGSVAFMASLWGNGILFSVLLKFTGVSSVLTWMSISFIHLRFRKAYLQQNKSLQDLPYRAKLYPVGNYISIALGIIVLIGQGVSIAKKGGDAMSIFGTYTGLFLFIIMYFGYKYFHKSKWVLLEECDFENNDCLVKLDEESESMDYGLNSE